MPLLTYGSALPTDFYDLVSSVVTSMLNAFWYSVTLLTALTAAPAVKAASQYQLGLGVADITGPIVETNMMGYADLSQTDTGIHMRQFSRAFIVADSSGDNRFVFINSDIAMGDSGVRRSIVSRLEQMYPDVYGDDNIALIGTHQHSGVGGYLENLLPQLTALGYVEQTANAIIDGTVLAVQRAHESLAPGSLSVGNTTILDANINRSPSAYLNNPEDERALYEYDQDKDMTVLRFDDADGNARGLLSFFAVHGTSIYQASNLTNNTLVSSDNKGMAAYLYEAYTDPDAMPGNATFVAGFTQANVGDTSPNTLGAYCESPGKEWHGMACEFNHSTCGGTVQDCHGRGPGFRVSDFESNRIIGEKQYLGARSIMEGSRLPVDGAVRSVHVYLTMANHTFTLPNGTAVKTCPAAMGYSFAGGTTDGPGAFDFVQGDNSTTQNPFWEIVKGAVNPYPSAAQIECQRPKPILLNTGYAHTPYEWATATVNIQMLRAGNFVMLIMPGELTTMAGRRIRGAIREELISSGILSTDAYVVMAGPANTYAHYVTTPEEYDVQRYEGASTIFGRYTLDAYIDKYTSLVPFLGDSPSGTPASDAAPAEQTSKAISLQTGVVFDGSGSHSFGDVLIDAGKSYTGGDTVEVQFVAANPRNNLHLGTTFLSVDRQVSGQWKTVRTDAHPSTRLHWVRTNTVLGTSTANITWTIEDSTEAGTYRIGYYGDSKPVIGSITAFSGFSSEFTVS
ncbi:Neutral/alkaline nonlysosomal ceramidase [Cylindrobasidium torrendii FP15055 ss-10]|uniref:Neutral ceramidase n=1 Tax=Cylindrobasidium torrendii FP15055 ss-10 TaxID=1314674 RepID=A0A0D7B9H4_9AGAR|nr:Neutral/alkaline nonlysosomal ceramidase [Cylindrobasidium torrendii FP15055 ss-10]